MARFVSFVGGLLLAVVPATFFLSDISKVGSHIGSLADAAQQELLPKVQFQVSNAIDDLSIDTIVDGTRSQLAELGRDVEKLKSVSLTESNFLRSNTQITSPVQHTPKYVREEVKKLARAFGVNVVNTAFSNKDGWYLDLATGDKIVLGVDDISGRLVRSLSTVVRLNSEQVTSARVIDARYVRGIAISNSPSTLVATH